MIGTDNSFNFYHFVKYVFQRIVLYNVYLLQKIYGFLYTATTEGRLHIKVAEKWPCGVLLVFWSGRVSMIS